MEIVHLTPSIPQAHGVAGLGPLSFLLFFLLYLTSVTAFVLRLYVQYFKDVSRIVSDCLCLTSYGTCLPLLLITLLQKYMVFSSQNRDQILSAGHGGCVSSDMANM